MLSRDLSCNTAMFLLARNYSCTWWMTSCCLVLQYFTFIGMCFSLCRITSIFIKDFITVILVQSQNIEIKPFWYIQRLANVTPFFRVEVDRVMWSNWLAITILRPKITRHYYCGMYWKILLQALTETIPVLKQMSD